ncbi:MAG: NAD dependent epimerase/dehydratase family enzyme [Sulfurimonas sp.]|jgi:NAD dependent epimerase/dehydratase family enzyme
MPFAEGASVLTDSKEIYPRTLVSAGYKFKYKTIKKSLEHFLS